MAYDDAAPRTPEPAAPAPDATGFSRWAFICHASDCRFRGAPVVAEALAREVRARGAGDIAVVRSGCLSLCGAGPALVTYPAGDVHLRVQPEDAADMAAHLARGEGLDRRKVRAPQWYREQIVARLGYFVEMLRRRAAQPSPAPSTS